MLRFIKRFLFVIFWEIICLLFLFVLDSRYYIAWLIFSLIFFFMIVVLSYKIIPGRRFEIKLKKLFDEYKLLNRLDEKALIDASTLEMQCPSCEHKSNLREFLDGSKCPKCDSKLWTTTVGDKGEQYFNIFKTHQKANQFFNSLSYRQKTRLKKRLFEEDAE